MKHRLVCLDGATLHTVGSGQWQAFNLPGVELTVYDRTAPGEIVDRLAGADMALTNKTVIRASDIDALPSLKYIGVLATGYNIVDIEAATKAGIVVTNIPSYSTASVAQQAIALLLAITNRVETYSSAVRGGKWSACVDFTFRDGEWHELSGKTFGVIGFGHIGSATAAIAAALGMRIAVFTSKSADSLPAGYVKMELDELFANADVLSLHCPLTPDTRNLVNSHRLALMKPSAIIINTSRGPVIDEAALAEALAEGRIHAAGVDVLSQEPPRADNPLLSAPRCIITPHIGWSSLEARQRLTAIAVENIKAYLDGNALNRVN